METQNGGTHWFAMKKLPDWEEWKGPVSVLIAGTIFFSLILAALQVEASLARLLLLFSAFPVLLLPFWIAKFRKDGDSWRRSVTSSPMRGRWALLLIAAMGLIGAILAWQLSGDGMGAGTLYALALVFFVLWTISK